jgi:hypothetical protein
MGRKRVSWKVVALVLVTLASCVSAGSKIGLHEYAACIDDVSGEVLTVGQKLVHLGFEIRLREAAAPVPILALQYAGEHYRESPEETPSHAEARAKSIAERMVHAWTLMDHGARIEVADDDWNTFRSRTKGTVSRHAAIYVRSPVPGAEPLRILTVYPQDVAGYPWISNEKSLAGYLASLIEAHYRLFSRNEIDLGKYRASPLDKTREGRIFTEIAARANDAAKKKGLSQFDAQTLREVLAGLPLSQRERLNRLATTPPMDWETTSK